MSGDVRVRSARLRLLLASSSVAALLIGAGTPAWSAVCTTVSSGGIGYTNSGSVTGLCVTSSVAAYIQNTGTISATGIRFVGGTLSGDIYSTGTIVGGISIDSNSSLGKTNAISLSGGSFSGGISNAGTITTSSDSIDVTSNVSGSSNAISNSGTISAGGFGIFIDQDSSFVGGITNSGTISSSGTGAAAIGLANVTSFSGGITNSGSGTISAADVAISILNVSSFSGGISNAGTISSNGYGIDLYAVSSFSNGITNSGTISAAGPGIYANGVTTFTGNISNSGTISGGTGILVSGGTTFSDGITNSGTISAGTRGIVVQSVTTFAGGISNSGTISAGGGYGILVGSVTTFTGGVGNSGTISAGEDGIYVLDGSTFTGGISNAGTISAVGAGIGVSGGSTFTDGISNAGTISAGTGIRVSSVPTFAGGISNSGTISAVGYGILVYSVTTFTGNISNSGTISARTGIYINVGVTFAAGGAIVNTGTITGSAAAIDASGASTAVTIDQDAGTITGAIKLSANADVLNISGGAIAGSIVGKGSSDTINFALGAGNSFTYGSSYKLTGINQLNIQSGAVILDGSGNAATNVSVSAGAGLQVGDAANAGASLTTTLADVFGTLSGHGSVLGDVTIESGGTLLPGGSIGTLTIGGALTLSSGSFYTIEISPTDASKTLANSATLNGATVKVVADLGTYAAQTYTILTTANTLGAGNTFNPTVTVSGAVLPSTPTLSYDATDAFLSIPAFTGTLILPPGATINEQNVANGINNFILNGGMPPSQFQTLVGLSDGSLLHALDQLSGEVATGAEQSAFQLGSTFLNLMLDPFVNGRGNLGGGAGEGSNPGLGFAPEQQASPPPDIALAYDEVFKAAPKPQNFEQRWGAWGSAYGGSSTTEGDPGVGSHDTSAQTYGFAAGMDYHVTPHSVAGFALAGGGTGWGLSDALGSGYSQAFQFGGYGIDWFGHAYLAGALSFSNHWFTTNRAALGDQLRANFVGQSYAARLEGGYRLTPSLPSPASGGGSGWGLGVTPYGAVQFQDFHTPAYSENDLTGGGLGLSYNAMNATDVRTELGARFDDPTLFYGKPLILFGRLAWAHDFVSDPALSAVFEALPGSAFTVNGAPIPHDSALTTAGVQYFLTANWSVIGKFEGEFAGGSQTYAGTGTLRYTW